VNAKSIIDAMLPLGAHGRIKVPGNKRATVVRDPYEARQAKRISARKFQGNDQHSWAVFIDGRPWITGLGRSEVPYYKQQAFKKLVDASQA